jgi:hypothetical protein
MLKKDIYTGFIHILKLLLELRQNLMGELNLIWT